MLMMIIVMVVLIKKLLDNTVEALISGCPRDREIVLVIGH